MSGFVDTGPATGAAEVTPSDTSDLTKIARALWIGSAGAIKVTTSDGDTVTLAGAQTGALIPLRVSRIWQTGTTASSIVALY